MYKTDRPGGLRAGRRSAPSPPSAAFVAEPVRFAAMKAYEATATINTPPETVWAILTDGAAYASWNSGVRGLEGHIAPGEKLKVTS